MGKRLIVTVDGPAGSGKSTVSKMLAKCISYTYLDTGLIYRAVAWRTMELGLAIEDVHSLGEICKDITIPFGVGAEMRVLIKGKDMSEALRTEQISMLASSISAIPSVREALLPLQREVGRHGGVVAEGRDMGTVVFPDADVKIFLNADATERARRRYLQLMENGKSADFEDVKRGLELRDHQDSTRAISPLKPATDSVIVDTTDLSIENVLEKMRMIIEAYAKQS